MPLVDYRPFGDLSWDAEGGNRDIYWIRSVVCEIYALEINGAFKIIQSSKKKKLFKYASLFILF